MSNGSLFGDDFGYAVKGGVPMDACFRCMARSCHCVRLTGGVWVDGVRVSRVVAGERCHPHPARLPVIRHDNKDFNICPCVFKAAAVATLWDAMTRMVSLDDAQWVHDMTVIDGLFL